MSRKKFLGNWTVFENGTRTEAAQYNVTIKEADPVNGVDNPTDVKIYNFYNYFRTTIKGYVTGDTLYIPNQCYEGKVVFGVGYIYSDNTYGQYGRIEMRYEIIDTATAQVNDFGYYPPDASDPSLWNK